MKITSIWSLAIAILVAGPAQAEGVTPVAPIMLWNGFTTESTKAAIKAFKAAKPKRKVEVYSGCPAEMLHRHEGGRLVSIVFLGQSRDARCFERMYADLLREHGQPQVAGTTFGSYIGYGNGGVIDTTSTGTLFIWRNGEKKTKLVRTPGNGYNLIFTVRPDKYIY